MPEIVGTTIALSGRTCIHSGKKYGPAYQKANSYHCPVGPHPGHAWVLLAKADLDSIASRATHTLTFIESTDTAAGTISAITLSIGPLYLVNSRRVFAGAAGDPDSIHLVHLVDVRSLGRYSTIDNGVYNIRSYANDQDYLTGATGFTWDSILSALWGQLPSVFGSWPGLPAGYTPDGTPEDFRYHGVNSWTAIHEVLRKISCTTAYDPAANTFAVVRLGAAQTITGLPDPEWDAEPVESDVTEIPETVRVYFHDHYQSYGQERDTELATNWSIKPPYATEDVATSVAGAVTGTILPVWDDLARALDENNSDTNATARADRAAQVASNYVLDWQTPRAHKVYQGVVTAAVCGSRVKRVLWRHWGDGMQTEVIEHPGIPAKRDSPIVLEAMESETIAPPDLARRSFPNYPRLSNIVQVDDGASATGAMLTANGDGLFPGFVQRWVAGAIATLDACWIRIVDLEGADSPSEATVIQAKQKDRFVGRLSGVETSAASTRPIYLARSGMLHWTVDADVGAAQNVYNAGLVEFLGSGTVATIVSNVAGVRRVTIAGAGGSTTWTVNADSGGTGTVNDAEEVEFIGGEGIDTTYAADGSNHDVTIDIDDTVAQNIALTATTGAFGGTNPVLIDSHGTANTFGLVAGNSILLTGGAGTVEIDVTASWSITGDTGGTGIVDDGELVSVIGATGGGIETTYAADGSDHDLTIAIDDSVAQNIALTETAGEESDISGTNPVLIDAHGTANTLGLIAGAGVTLVGGTGTVEINANRVLMIGKIKTGETLTFGGSAVVDPWTGTPNSETDSTLEVTAYDWCLVSGQTVAAGRQVVIAWANDAWYVISAQCPE